jgi:hypothetical protein
VCASLFNLSSCVHPGFPSLQWLCVHLCSLCSCRVCIFVLSAVVVCASLFCSGWSCVHLCSLCSGRVGSLGSLSGGSCLFSLCRELCRVCILVQPLCSGCVHLCVFSAMVNVCAALFSLQWSCVISSRQVWYNGSLVGEICQRRATTSESEVVALRFLEGPCLVPVYVSPRFLETSTTYLGVPSTSGGSSICFKEK